MKAPWLVLTGSVILVGGLTALLLWKNEPNRPEPLILQCAAALREPIEEIIPIYEQQTGQRIEVRYGESQKVLTDMRLSGQGDLFLPADDSYISDAQKDDLLGEVFPLASMNATLAIKSGSTKQIATWNDVLREDVAVAIANPEAAAISRLTAAHLGERWKQLRQKKNRVEMGPVTFVANAVKVGHADDVSRPVDAGIIWDNMLSSPNYRDLKMVRLKELDGITATVKIGVIKKSSKQDQSLAFARFLTAHCGDIFQAHGFTSIGSLAAASNVPAKKEASRKDGPSEAKNEPHAKVGPSSEPPEIVLYAGAMVRPAIEETIKEFEAREGVRVIRVYNGCGILVSQMKVLKEKNDRFPDLYFSCDTTFMDQVVDLFEKPQNISKNQLVIAVKKGNIHGVKSLKDLGKEGLKIGVGHEQQCALGAITQGVLIRSKTLKAVQGNVVVRSPSGDLLVNQLRTGSLDAVIAYISNVKPYENELDAIKVEEVNCAPTQPIAISKTSAHPDVVKRLLKALETTQSKERFEKLGFGWELQP